MDQSIKGRIRLWLRSERAMGLHSLPLREDGMLMPALCPLPPAVSAATQSRSPAPVAGSPSEPHPAQNLPRGGDDLELLIAPERAAFSGPPLAREEKRRLLEELYRSQVSGCSRCGLCQQRTNVVFGEGDVDAQIVFIGEGPGETEDRTGRPFVGRAGQKLDEMIAAMGLRRDQVYICNIVKCRPPDNREPGPDEVEACTPYLVRQLEIIRPRVIVTLGRPAAQYMLQTKQSMGSLRGQWRQWRGIKLMPTFHPSYILRVYTLETRKAVWSDLQKVMAEVGLKLPKQRSQT